MFKRFGGSRLAGVAGTLLLMAVSAPGVRGGAAVDTRAADAIRPNGTNGGHAGGAWAPTPKPDAAVRATDMLTFEPRTVTIPVGGTVEWTNGSVLVHTVTDDPDEATVEGSSALPDGAESFDSGNMAPGAKFSHTFKVPGTYRYFCKPHEAAKMWGTVIVKG